MQQDLKIMIEAATLQIDSSVLNEKYLLPYTNVGQTIFFGEFNLLQDQVDAKRRPSALTRLNRYTGLEKGYTPVTEQAKAQFEAAMKQQEAARAVQGAGRAGSREHRRATSTASASSTRSTRSAARDKALDALDTQLKDYDAWVKATVMPHARDDFKLPPELYADNLKNVGLDIAPDALDREGRARVRRDPQRDAARSRRWSRRSTTSTSPTIAT